VHRPVPLGVHLLAVAVLLGEPATDRFGGDAEPVDLVLAGSADIRLSWSRRCVARSQHRIEKRLFRRFGR